MGNLRFNLGQVKYDVEGQSSFPREAKIGLGVGAALLVPVVLIIIFMYRYVLNWQICFFVIHFRGLCLKYSLCGYKKKIHTFRTKITVFSLIHVVPIFAAPPSGHNVFLIPEVPQSGGKNTLLPLIMIFRMLLRHSQHF